MKSIFGVLILIFATVVASDVEDFGGWHSGGWGSSPYWRWGLGGYPALRAPYYGHSSYGDLGLGYNGFHGLFGNLNSGWW